MAHDFGIHKGVVEAMPAAMRASAVKQSQYNSEPIMVVNTGDVVDFSKAQALAGSKSCYFFGYALGVMYRVFNAGHCDGGVSGTCEAITVTREQAISALSEALPMLGDQTEKFERYIEKVLKPAKPKQKFTVVFS